jgi:Kdo2-lipid IVA lauroyltransferase/acyltransferase
MKYIEFIFLRSLYFSIEIMPFCIIYGLSDVCSVLMQYVFRYRTDTVSKNLNNSFPGISKKEKKKITRRFYKGLCDVALESIKGYSMKPEHLMKRYRFLNPEVVNKYAGKGQDVIVAVSHYCNWEWGSQVAKDVYKHRLISLYKPLTNKYSDNFVRKQRTKRSMELMSIYDAKLIFLTKEERPKAYFFIGDQNAVNPKKSIWVNFLNQDTACLRGIETYAKLFSLPVIYIDVQRVKRGYYTLEMTELCSDPSSTSYGEITESYMRKLESIIIKKPEDWLWSHRRWKLKR